MSADGRFGIINHPEDPDEAVLLYDGEPIGVISRRPDRMRGLHFVTCGLRVHGGPDILDPDLRDSQIGGTVGLSMDRHEYAEWKATLGLTEQPPA